jgi:ABC-type dipeptide/oligopeptide/nickel transport system permease subunit
VSLLTPPAVPPQAADVTAVLSQRPAGLARDTLANIARQRSAIIGGLILAFLILLAVAAPLIATHDPNLSLIGEPGLTRRSGPCLHVLGCAAARPEHLFGIDGNFRDLFSRVIYGARTSLTAGFAAIMLAIVLGTSIGAAAAYIGGLVDNALMRLMDIVLAFPSLLLAIAIVTALGRSLTNALLAIGVVNVPVFARIARASVLEIKGRDYVTASRALGESGIGILFRRILPNSITPLVVAGTLGIGTAVLEIAALTFVGVSGDLEQPEWGSIIGLEKDQLFNSPHIILAPGLAITLTVLAFNLLGDGIRDALDPRLNR